MQTKIVRFSLEGLRSIEESEKLTGSPKLAHICWHALFRAGFAEHDLHFMSNAPDYAEIASVVDTLQLIPMIGNDPEVSHIVLMDRLNQLCRDIARATNTNLHHVQQIVGVPLRWKQLTTNIPDYAQAVAEETVNAVISLNFGGAVEYYLREWDSQVTVDEAERLADLLHSDFLLPKPLMRLVAEKCLKALFGFANPGEAPIGD